MDLQTRVLFLDLINGVKNPVSYSDVVKNLTNEIDETEEVESGGIQRPWNLLILDSSDCVIGNVQLYESILRSSVRPRIILLIANMEDAISGKNHQIVLPEIFDEQASLVRVVNLTSTNGTLWSPGKNIPDGVAVWKRDPEGIEALNVIIGTMRIPEIYDSCFEATKGSGKDLWSVGTKQVWFGTLPPSAMADALTEVGRRLLGEDGRVALLRKMEKWRFEDDLVGLSEEEGIISKGGKTDLDYQNLSDLTSQFLIDGGCKSRRGAIKRIASHPMHLTKLAKELSYSLENLNNETKLLIEEIDPTDGFQPEEARRLEKLGLRLHPQDNSRDEKYRDSDLELLKAVLREVEKVLNDGHSISPIKNELIELIGMITPRTSNEILEGQEIHDRGSEYDFHKGGYKGVAFNDVIGKIREGEKSAPKSYLTKLSRRLARLVLPMKNRVIFAFVYFWLFGVTLYELFDQGQSNEFFMFPDQMRSVASNIFIGLFLLLSLMIILFGLLFNLVDDQISKWAKSIGVVDIERNRLIENHRFFLSQLVLNEWVLWKSRMIAAEQLQTFYDVIDQITIQLQHLLIDSSEEIIELDKNKPRPNPGLRADFNEYRQAGHYSQFDTVKTILRNDILKIVLSKLKIRSLEIRGNNRSQIPAILYEDVETPLRSYIGRVTDAGVLAGGIFTDETSLQQRKTLARKYWDAVDGISKVVNDVVLYPDLAPVIQMIEPNDILLLDQTEANVVNIRFCPEPGKDLFGSLSATSDANEITFTETINGAGVLRLVGYREGVLTYSRSSESSESLEP